MGTHPIFESDFDCLTEMNQLRISLRQIRLCSPRIVERNLSLQPPKIVSTINRTKYNMAIKLQDWLILYPMSFCVVAVIVACIYGVIEDYFKGVKNEPIEDMIDWYYEQYGPPDQQKDKKE